MVITNKAIIELYKAEQGLPLDYPLFTYAAWIKQGYRVKKGEASRHRVQMCKVIKQKETNEKKAFKKIMYLFEESQVTKI